MEKYELRKGEKFIEEYVDNSGKPVIIFENKDGVEMHGFVIDIDDDLALLLERAAAVRGIDPEEYVHMALNAAIEQMIEEGEKRKAIEEISD